MTSAPSTYRTRDIAIAAFLSLHGMQLLLVASTGRGTGEFVFKDRADRQGLVMSFLNHEGKVDPSDFLNTLRSLKSAAIEAQSNCVTEMGIRDD